MITLILLSFITNCLSITDNETQIQLNEIRDYLIEYGYLQIKDETFLQNINEKDISNALIIFQEFNKIPADGKLNNETLNLMLKFRCGNADIISDFRLTAFKWNKSVISWHYYVANQPLLELTEKAFSVWEKHSGLRFKHDRMNYDILISNKRLKHMMQTQSHQCSNAFEGKGRSLAHAFHPDRDNTVREIHIDEDENWSYSINKNVSVDQVSLFATLIHEIGHALGLSHSDVADSVMNAFYSGKIELGNDDVLAIQNLYGKPSVTSSLPTEDKQHTVPQMEEDQPVDTDQIDLCRLKNINTFLIANNRLYILYEKWLWIVNTNEMTYSTPVIITDWLTFLPKNFSKLLAVYQRPSGEIVMFIDSFVYMFDLMSLRLINGYPRYLQSVFNIQPNKLHAIFNSYTGRTFIFHDDNYYREVDECSFTTKSWGYISDLFPGVPPKIDSSFRYIDGNLYFFKNNTIYMFNEFTRALVKVERNNLSIFGLECVNDDILNKLKDLITKLLIQRKN